VRGKNQSVNLLHVVLRLVLTYPTHLPRGLLPFSRRKRSRLLITIHMQAIPQSDLSMVSAATTRSTALDVCYSVYGETAIQADDVEKFYEANASMFLAGCVNKIGEKS